MLGPAAATQTMSRRGMRSLLKINRNRLGVAKKERRTQQEKQRGHQYRAEWIDVL
jgi:hypothetical protein